MNKNFTLDEIANTLKVSSRTVLREIKRGNLKSRRVGRRHIITNRDLQKYLTRSTVGTLLDVEQFFENKKPEMISFLQQLVSMSSENNELGQEGRLAYFIKSKFEENGIRSVVYNEGSAVAVRASYGYADDGILLNCPLDTITTGSLDKWKYPPFDGVIKAGKMYGRGTADCKAGIVAMIYTLFALKRYISEEGIRVELVFDGGEQSGEYLGMKLALKKGLPVKSGIIGYAGDEHELYIGARGYHRYTFVSLGHSAHTGARLKVGINAIEKMAKFISKLTAKKLPKSEPDFFSFGQRLTFSIINGGRGINIVPDECRARLDVRTSPEFDKARVSDFIRKTISELEFEDKDIRLEFQYDVGEEGYLLKKDESIIRVLKGEIDNVYQRRKVKLTASGPAHVGNLLVKYGVPVVVWGPRGTNVHSYDEYVELDSISKTSEIYTKTIIKYFK
jgi:excisionase family DNA binding protein